MMRKTKKFLLGGLLCVGITLIGVGCKEPAIPQYEQITPEPITYYLELDKYEIENLVVGDTASIVVSYETKDGVSLSCRSEDTTVATVALLDDYCVEITGYQPGSTTVVIEYGEFKKECTVSVGTNGMLPALGFSTSVENGFATFVGSEYPFDSYVSFNGKKFEDFTVEYELEDKSFGAFDGETLTVGNKCGTTNIAVTASWRGLESPLLTKTFPLTVDVPVELKINGGFVNEFTLYTVESHGGETYETDQPVVATVKENGEAIENFTVSIENHQAGDGSESEVAAYEDGTLTALHYGTCELVVRYDSAYVGEKVYRFDVEVVRPLANYGENIEKFSILDGELPIADIFGTDSVEIESATQDEQPLTVEGNKVLGVKAKDKTKMSEETLTLWSDKVGYTVTVEAYQKILRTADDFKVLATGTAGAKINGYFYVDCDIDEIVLPYNAESSFDGVFDGNGKTIKVTPKRKGVFGVLNGTLKNVNIVVEELDDSTPYTCVAVCFNMNDNALVENVNVKVAPNSEVSGGFTVFGSMTTKSRLKNVVVEVSSNVKAEQGNSYGVLGSFFNSSMKGQMNTDGTYASLWQDVYVISNTAKYLLYITKQAKEENNYCVVASNDAENTELTTGAPDVTVAAGVKRYDTIAAMQADKANLDLSVFDTELWDVSSGFPIWKNAMEQYVKFLVNGSEAENIALDTENKNATITLATALAEYTPTLTVVSGTCVEINQNVLTGKSSGTATVEASYTLNGVVYTKQYNVTVNFASSMQTVNGKFYVERPAGEDETTATGTSLTWDGLANGQATLLVKGMSFEYTVANNAISVAWTSFASAGVALGETVSIEVVDSKGVAWILNEVMYVTKAIKTEADFATIGTTLKAETDGILTDVYYVLANNIECESTTDYATHQWSTFAGIFDGQGYYVNNLYVGEYGIFGQYLGRKGNRGLVRNIAFTNVNSTVEAPNLISNMSIANGAGGLDNVYVSAKHANLTLFGTASSLSDTAFNAVILENCAGVYRGNSSSVGYFISTNSLYMISAEETPVAADRYATNTTKTGVNTYTYDTTDAKRGGMYWFASYADMTLAVKATATASQPTVAYFNDCWDLTNGYPVWKNLPAAEAQGN